MTLAERINAGIKAFGKIPLPSAYILHFVAEARQAGSETQVRICSKWYWLTSIQEHDLDRLLAAKGF